MRWLDERELAAWRTLQLMQMQLTAALTRDLAEHSRLSYQDYVVLVALTDAPFSAARSNTSARFIDGRST